MISFNDFDTAKVVISQPEPKKIPGENGGSYHSIGIKYNYGSSDLPKVDDFLLEGPEVTSNGGIIEKKTNGKMEYSMMVSLPQDSKDVAKYTSVIDTLYMGCAQVIGSVKGALGFPDFDPSKPGYMKIFTNPVYRARDKQTNELVVGKAPVQFMKLFKYNMAGIDIKTLFSVPTKDPTKPISMDWDDLKSVKVTFIPLLHIRNIYVGGGKMRMQIKLKSAVITRPIEAIGSVNQQTTALATVKTDMLDALSASVAKLRLDRGGKDNKDHQGSLGSKDSKAMVPYDSSGSNKTEGTGMVPFGATGKPMTLNMSSILNSGLTNPNAAKPAAATSLG